MSFLLAQTIQYMILPRTKGCSNGYSYIVHNHTPCNQSQSTLRGQNYFQEVIGETIQNIATETHHNSRELRVTMTKISETT